MSRLLHISASPRGAESISLAVARTFTDEYLATHPGSSADHFDLWDGTLPEFGPAAAHAKMTVFGAEPRRASRRRRGPRPCARSSASTPTTGTCSACRCGTRGCRTS
ncbi:NAD(P)H-dependent oxidoreductase [Nonomuraea thailandensis]